ncbi:helix-turn-helix transcriptional regulator [Streptomyces sp. NPDC094034]|uniref:helix-turn-helix transcriptional regulator n=1 Tax=Streptomyces sp. NPDC094034 TaxID=3155309 RepID=UPI003319A68E
MSDFDAIDSLLASLTPQPALPEAQVRRGLRERAGLSKAQVARALGVSSSTVTGWETGRDPSGELRTKYAYLLDGLAVKLAPSVPQSADEASAPRPALDESTTSPAAGDGLAADDDMDDVEALAAPESCVLCGQPARHQVAGFPQHLDPAQCATTAPAPDTPAQQMGGRTAKPVKAAPAGRRAPTASDADPSGPIAAAVAEALEAHEGDVEAATASLVKRVMVCRGVTVESRCFDVRGVALVTC